MHLLIYIQREAHMAPSRSSEACYVRVRNRCHVLLAGSTHVQRVVKKKDENWVSSSTLCFIERKQRASEMWSMLTSHRNNRSVSNLRIFFSYSKRVNTRRLSNRFDRLFKSYIRNCLFRLQICEQYSDRSEFRNWRTCHSDKDLSLYVIKEY